MEKDPFKEYLRESEPDKAHKGYAWSTAIGLQAVDGLKPSKYLIDTAIQNIEGKITMKEAQSLIDSYYEERPVFYNYILKCFVLIDLKTEKITHQDVGQMDMYIRMYDELKRSEGDNPTIGIVLCSDTDDDIARYSVMHGNEQLFASKYKLYLPTKEELKAEIETQKAMFYLQQQDNEEKETE